MDASHEGDGKYIEALRLGVDIKKSPVFGERT